MNEILSFILNHVKKNINGRIADEQNNTLKVMEYAVLAGDGDHLEIGSLFGGSAICVALAKRYYNLDGKVVCIDPLNGYYLERFKYSDDLVTKMPVDLETFLSNIEMFGVEDKIEIIQKNSYPFPNELSGIRFVSTYIDGDHWDDAPMRDWMNVKDITEKYVIFDNYDELHPSVLSAGEIAIKDDKWENEYSGGITLVLRKI